MKSAILLATLLAAAGTTFGGEFRPYPGAKAEDFAAWKRRHPEVNVPSGMHIERYSTPDPLEKVVAFYAAMGTQVEERTVNLTTGEKVQMRTLVLDGAKKDLGTSKLIVRIQRPYLDFITPELRGEGAKEVTAIEVIRRD